MRGFSLVELIVTLALLSILAIGSSRFLLDATDGYATTNARIQLAAIGSTALELSHRELSTALPLSTRVSSDGKCVEWLSVMSGGRYERAPIGYSSSILGVLGLRNTVGQRLAIPSIDLYGLSNPGGVSPTVVAATATATDELTIQLSEPHEFSVGSPGSRIYTIDDPESLCFAHGRLWHYRNYGYNAMQVGPAGLPGVLPNRVLLAEHVDVAASRFNLTQASLERNGLIGITLVLRNDYADIQLERFINIRNVP